MSMSREDMNRASELMVRSLRLLYRDKKDRYKPIFTVIDDRVGHGIIAEGIDKKFWK